MNIILVNDKTDKLIKIIKLTEPCHVPGIGETILIVEEHCDKKDHKYIGKVSNVQHGVLISTDRQDDQVVITVFMSLAKEE